MTGELEYYTATGGQGKSSRVLLGVWGVCARQRGGAGSPPAQTAACALCARSMGCPQRAGRVSHVHVHPVRMVTWSWSDRGIGRGRRREGEVSFSWEQEGEVVE